MALCAIRGQTGFVNSFKYSYFKYFPNATSQLQTLRCVVTSTTGSGSCQGRSGISRRLLKNVQSVRRTVRLINMDSATCTLLNSGNIHQFIDSFDTVLTDCDGVLWNDMDPITGSAETIELMKKMRKRVFYVTNNSGKTREEYAQKCVKLGFHAETEEIIGTAYVTAQYIKNVLKYKGKVYLIGGQGLKQELDKAGIPNFGSGRDDTEFEGMSLLSMASMPLDPEVKCVVAGFDMKFNFAKLQKAQSFLMQPGCHFVGTNADTCIPLGKGCFFPGTGAIVGCVEIAAGRKATICGKPHRPIFEVINEKHKLDPARTIMIGDRCNTDIELAHNCGMLGVLVLTGYNTLEDVARLRASADPKHKLQVPHYYIPRLGDLKDLLEQTDK